jgi:hypothetical protein
MEVMLPDFFSENVTVITLKLTWMIHTSSAIMGLFSHKVITFNTLLPMLSKTLYTSVIKFPALTSEHIMRTLFWVVICKVAFM